MKKRVHKVVVEVASSHPVSEKTAINALTRILEQQNCLRRTFMFRPFYTPRFKIRSWLKSFTYAAGKHKEEGRLL